MIILFLIFFFKFFYYITSVCVDCQFDELFDSELVVFKVDVVIFAKLTPSNLA